MLKSKNYLFKVLVVIAIIVSTIFVFSGCGKKNKNQSNTDDKAYLYYNKKDRNLLFLSINSYYLPLIKRTRTILSLASNLATNSSILDLSVSSRSRSV